MTLFDLIVGIAVLLPFGLIVAESPKLGIAGSVIGFCIAAVLGFAQVFLNYVIVSPAFQALKDGRRADLLFVAYLVAVIPVGILLSLAMLMAVRSLVGG